MPVPELSDWFRRHESQVHPILFAEKLRESFDLLHPFPDANGRVARLLRDWWLLAKGYPLPVESIPQRWFDPLLADEHNLSVVEGYEHLIEGIERTLVLMKSRGR